MKEIRNYNFAHERALYAVKNIKLKQCTFSGREDGESAIKEAKNIYAEDCEFELRYPFWHDKKIKLNNVKMSTSCRAAMWYSRDIFIEKSTLLGIKALRECQDISVVNSRIVSPEFGWRCKNAEVENVYLQSEYAFLMSRDVIFKNVTFTGKYAFQYVQKAEIKGCRLDTKDAFWHSKNVTIADSVVRGEYLGWYSENLTLINCKIAGTQPLCYCKGLKLVNCEMENTDLSFEYSQVKARVKGNIVSVKNPKSGKITADSVDEVIITPDSRYKPRCKVVFLRGKRR